MQGIGARSAKGQASNPMAETLAQLAGPHCVAAFDCIKEEEAKQHAKL